MTDTRLFRRIRLIFYYRPMARNLIPALLLSASALMLPARATTDTDNQEQFSCDVREFILKNTRYRLFDCLDGEGFYARDGRVDHVVKEKEKKDQVAGSKLEMSELDNVVLETLYDPMSGGSEETSALLDKQPSTPVAMSSKQQGIFQSLYELLLELEKKDEE